MSDHLIIYTIRYNAPDYPGRYLVVKSEIVPHVPYEEFVVTVADSLDEAREAVPDGLMRFARHPNDDPNVVESWL